jgi:hypothetical protein
VSRLRAKCPNCRAHTAVAVGPEYECHSCGRTFAAGLVRVPRAWGRDGEALVESASLPVPYPEAAVIEQDSLSEQSFAVALELPERPLVLGGCCCAHIGAVEALSARHDRISLLWFDAHGDLNTPETSTTGNEWGMPLRMLLDSGAVGTADLALVGARNLDPPEEEYIAATGLGLGPEAVYGIRRGCTSRSIWTRSTRARWRSSCRSPMVLRSPRSRSSSCRCVSGSPFSAQDSRPCCRVRRISGLFLASPPRLGFSDHAGANT